MVWTVAAQLMVVGAACQVLKAWRMVCVLLRLGRWVRSASVGVMPWQMVIEKGANTWHDGALSPLMSSPLSH